MKALILAAGYATRLYPLTLDRAKPLLPVAQKPVIEHIIERIEEIDDIDQILVVTNQKFIRQFERWQKDFSTLKALKIINDGTTCERDRLGAVGDMDLVIREEKLDDDLLIIAGDNLFELGLREFVDFAKHRKPASSIGLYNLRDAAAVKSYSQVRLDTEDKVIEFTEKPEYPTSTLVAKCIYFFPKDTLWLIAEYLKTNNPIDAPGHYISWLYQKEPVYGFTFCGKWYDIGNRQIYEEANKEFLKQEKGEN